MNIVYSIQKIENGWVVFHPKAISDKKISMCQRFFESLEDVLDYLRLISKTDFEKISLKKIGLVKAAPKNTSEVGQEK